MKEQQLNDIDLALNEMLNNTLRNYIVPGLNSHLVGGGEFGKVRLFEAIRLTREFITPHSHRFNFTCLVLQGSVRNTIYIRTEHINDEQWCLSTINQVCGLNGLNEYEHHRSNVPSHWRAQTTVYSAGDTYNMTYGQIHSIEFDRHTKVLFFEGPQKVSNSEMIEPWINGKVIPTFKTEDWMFEKDIPNLEPK